MPGALLDALPSAIHRQTDVPTDRDLSHLRYISSPSVTCVRVQDFRVDVGNRRGYAHCSEVTT